MSQRSRTRTNGLACAALACLLPWTTSCTRTAPCAVPGVVEACSCASGSGARACLPERVWGTCDCSGAIALPRPVSTQRGSATAGSTGAPATGTGGSAPTGSGGASSAPAKDGSAAIMKDGGSLPQSDAGVARDASVTRDAQTDAAVDGGPPVSPLTHYRACTAASDCDMGAKCVQTPNIPNTATVCSPSCVNVSDCPVPEGSYEAKVSCVTGYCELDCTPVLFAPLLTCPTGLTCIAAQLGNAFCHHAM